MPTPTVAGWGFLMHAASHAVWNSPPSLHVGEEEGRGKQAVVPPAALPPSVLHALVATVSHPLRRVLCVPTRHLSWDDIWARPQAYLGPWSRLGIVEDGDEENDLRDCGTLH